MAHTEQLTFGGWRTYDDGGLVIVGTPDMEPPGVKTEMVDIPGGDGSVDLSEFSGDVRYDNRKMTFEMLMTGRTPDGLEVEKTDLSRRLHGQRDTFTLSWDPGFTYTGRAAITDYPNAYRHGLMKLEVVADPFKYGGTQTWHINAAGGVTLLVPCGRRKWSPVIEVEREALVSYDGQGWTIPAGASTISDLWLEPGDNELTINTDPGYGLVTWNDVSAQTWDDLATTYGVWYLVAAGGSPRQVSVYWTDVAGAWSSVEDKRWIELVHDEDADATYEAYVQVEIYEL